MREYTIKKGDNLTKIAKAYGISVNDLVKLNNIEDPNFIKAGSKIVVSSSPSNTNANYSIGQGETLGSIAKAFNVDVNTLAKLNGIENPDYVQAGQQIIIPKAEVKTKNITGKVYSEEEANKLEQPSSTYIAKKAKEVSVTPRKTFDLDQAPAVQTSPVWQQVMPEVDERTFTVSKNQPVKKQPVKATPANFRGNVQNEELANQLEQYTITKPKPVQKQQVAKSVPAPPTTTQRLSVTNTSVPTKQSITTNKKIEEPGFFENIGNEIEKDLQIVKTGIKRKILPHLPGYDLEGKEAISSMDLSTKPKQNTNKTTVSPKREYDFITGNKIADPEFGNDIYHRSRYIDLDNPVIKTGFHNRGDKVAGQQPFKEILFSNFDNNVFDPIHFLNKKGRINDNDFYLGSDKNGKLIVGFGKDIKNKDGNVSRFSLIKNVKGFSKTQDGSFDLQKSSFANKAKDPFLQTKDNKKVPINILSSAENEGEKKYGQYYGGSFIILSPNMDKKVLVSGSLKEIDEALEKFKKDNKVDSVNIVKVDNGSYSRQFATDNPSGVNQQFWNKYEGLNNAGGNAIYMYEQGGEIRASGEGPVDVSQKGYQLRNPMANQKLYPNGFGIAGDEGIYQKGGTVQVLDTKVVNGKKMYLVEGGPIKAEKGGKVKAKPGTNISTQGINPSENTRTKLTPSNKVDIERIKEAETINDKIRAKELYEQIAPTGFNDIGNYVRYFTGGKRDYKIDPTSEESWKQYLGINENPKYVLKSSTRPSISSDQNAQYYRLNKGAEDKILNFYKDKLNLDEYAIVDEFDLNEEGGWNPLSALQHFTVSRGTDEKGDYISYYDKWDLPEKFQNRLKGTPFEFYNRMYIPKEKYHFDSKDVYPKVFNSVGKKIVHKIGNPIKKGNLIETPYQDGGVIQDDRGQWAYPGEVTKINSPYITMKGVNGPLYLQPNVGKGRIAYPNEEHHFPKADYVIEYPITWQIIED